jgi:hypothetical protein
VIFNRECRVPFVLAGRPRLASGLLPGLVRARDRFTARSPSSGVGDYFRFLLHRGVSQPPDPDLDRVWAIVPVTVSRASSAASGRCRPALTGVGAVPCDQSRAVTASYSRRITLLRPGGIVADHSTRGPAKTTRFPRGQGAASVFATWRSVSGQSTPHRCSTQTRVRTRDIHWFGVSARSAIVRQYQLFRWCRG